MGLFKKKEKKEVKETAIPRMPELPKLPEFNYPEDYPIGKISPLPSLPNDPFTEKFSQDNIKKAITGKREVEEEADDFAIEEEMQMMQKPRIIESKNFVKEEKVKPLEPLFIRIDKFEEGSESFENIKKQINEIEKFFNNLKKVKENEDNEIQSFEKEIKEIKEKLENIDKNIFSKIN